MLPRFAEETEVEDLLERTDEVDLLRDNAPAVPLEVLLLMLTLVLVLVLLLVLVLSWRRDTRVLLLLVEEVEDLEGVILWGLLTREVEEVDFAMLGCER